MKWLRLIAAGLFVYCAILAAGILAVRLAGGPHIWLTVPIFLGAIALAMYLFNARGANILPGPSAEERLASLEREHRIVDTTFSATRAFGVDDFEDEGTHYFLELSDGRGVLALTGQYLYEYEPSTDDDDGRMPRRFPCTEFTVRRHRDEGHVVDLVCRGEVLEPEIMAPGDVIAAWFADGFAPEDGAIIDDVTYDELKRARTAAPARQRRHFWRG